MTYMSINIYCEHCKDLHPKYISTTTLEMYPTSVSGAQLPDVAYYISSTSISCDNYNNLDAICITSLYSWKLHLLVVHWKNLHLQHDWKDVIWSYMHL